MYLVLSKMRMVYYDTRIYVYGDGAYHLPKI